MGKLKITGIGSARFEHGFEKKCMNSAYYAVEPITALTSSLDGKFIGYYSAPAQKALLMTFSEFHKWRNSLSVCVTGVPLEEVWKRPLQYNCKPFFKLLDFGECTGAFGPKTSKDLFNHFSEYRHAVPESIRRVITDEAAVSKWLSVYKDLREVLGVASNNGFLIFSSTQED